MAPRPYTKPRCHNCRRKKIKCDYARPSCGPCSKSKFPCEGYEKELVFVSQYSSMESPKPAAAIPSNTRTRSPYRSASPARSVAESLPDDMVWFNETMGDSPGDSVGSGNSPRSLPSDKPCFITWDASPRLPAKQVQAPSTDKVRDVLNSMPTHMALTTTLCSEYATMSSMQEFQAKHDRLHAVLDEFLSEQQTAHGGALFQVDETPSMTVFGHGLHYKAVTDCIAMSLYWTGKLLLFEAWERVRLYQSSVLQSFLELPEMNNEYDVELGQQYIIAEKMADRICLTTPSLFRMGADTDVLDEFGLPIRVAGSFYAKHACGDQAKWCNEMSSSLESNVFPSEEPLHMSCQAEPSFLESVDALRLPLDMDAALFDNLDPLLFTSL